MNKKLDLFSICVDIRSGKTIPVEFKDILRELNQTLKVKNYSDLQFIHRNNRKDIPKLGQKCWHN